MIVLYLVILFIFLLNIWVWFFPNIFKQFIKLGEGAIIEKAIPSLKEVWKIIENPHYIWLPRIIFGLVFILILVMAYMMIFFW